MIELLKQEIGELTYADNDGVMLTYEEGEICMISCDSLELAEKLLGDCPYTMIAIHQREMAEPLCHRFGIEHIEECWQGVYTKAEPMEEYDADIRLLGMEYLDFIAEHYDHGDRDFIEGLLRQQVLYGIFVEGCLAGFEGKHCEGAIGLLYILPEYRRMGLAEKLGRFYINLEHSRGHTPYGQIFVGNWASRRLQEKMGLEFAEKTVTWLWR